MGFDRDTSCGRWGSTDTLSFGRWGSTETHPAEDEVRLTHYPAEDRVRLRHVLRKMGLEKIIYPRNPVKRRITTSTPLGYLIGYLKYYMGTSPKKNL